MNSFTPGTFYTGTATTEFTPGALWYVAESAPPGGGDWMDGSMTEDEWWAYRRRRFGIPRVRQNWSGFK